MELGDAGAANEEAPACKEPRGTYISTINHCQTAEASHLCIFDACSKLKSSDSYNIGGTYLNNDPELWFYFTTSYYHCNNHLLNLFFCHRKQGSVSIQVPGTNELTENIMYGGDDGSFMLLSNALPKVYTFKSHKPDQHHYVKTFCFSVISHFPPASGLIIPITIEVRPADTQLINDDIVKAIKLQHDLSRLLSLQEKTDFVLESATHKQFKTYKVLLAAHSPVLRTVIKEGKSASLFIDISDNDVELLLEFIYTGTIKNVKKQDCLKLLEIANKFQLHQLFLLTQHVIGEQIKVTNAVETAVVAKKFNLEELQRKVFEFIIKNPEVMKTDAWLNLEDVELTKSLLQYRTTKD